MSFTLKILIKKLEKYTEKTKWENFTFWWKLGFSHHLMKQKKCNFKVAFAASEWIVKNVSFWEDAKPEDVADFYMKKGFKGTIFEDLMI